MVKANTQIKHLERGSAHIWIVVVLAAIILGLLGFVLWQQLTKTNTSTAPKTNTYTSTDTGTYVKSFKYPATWQVIDKGEEICARFDDCASPPVLIATDQSNAITLTLSTPQSASDVSIDEQATSDAGSNGTVVSDFKSLDGLEARKIEHPDSKTTTLIVFAVRGGYGYISFGKAIANADIDTVLSSWKWE